MRYRVCVCVGEVGGGGGVVGEMWGLGVMLLSQTVNYTDIPFCK